MAARDPPGSPAKQVVPMMADVDLYRLASSSLWVALVALVLGGISLVIFFAGPGEPFGSINDALVAVTVIALIPAILAVDRLAGDQLAPWVRIVSIAAIAGTVLVAVGNVLLIVRVISLEDSYITGGLGILPVVVWLILVTVLGLTTAILPASAGWAALATLALIVVTAAIAAVTLGPVLWVASIGLLVAMSVWLILLAGALADRAGAAPG